jgi:hypothetical protein
LATIMLHRGHSVAGLPVAGGAEATR